LVKHVFYFALRDVRCLLRGLFGYDDHSSSVHALVSSFDFFSTFIRFCEEMCQRLFSHWRFDSQTGHRRLWSRNLVLGFWNYNNWWLWDWAFFDWIYKFSIRLKRYRLRWVFLQLNFRLNLILWLPNTLLLAHRDIIWHLILISSILVL